MDYTSELRSTSDFDVRFAVDPVTDPKHAAATNQSHSLLHSHPRTPDTCDWEEFGSSSQYSSAKHERQSTETQCSLWLHYGVGHTIALNYLMTLLSLVSPRLSTEISVALDQTHCRPASSPCLGQDKSSNCWYSIEFPSPRSSGRQCTRSHSKHGPRWPQVNNSGQHNIRIASISDRLR